MMASSLASARASSRVATTEAAAVRISVSADALMSACGSPVSGLDSRTTPWCASLPRAGLPGKMQIALSPYAASGSGTPPAPARIAGMSTISPGGDDPGRRGRLHHRPQRLVHLATGQGGQRTGDQIGALPVGQQLVHVTGAEDEQLQVRHASRLITAGGLRPAG